MRPVILEWGEHCSVAVGRIAGAGDAPREIMGLTGFNSTLSVIPDRSSRI